MVRTGPNQRGLTASSAAAARGGLLPPRPPSSPTREQGNARTVIAVFRTPPPPPGSRRRGARPPALPPPAAVTHSADSGARSRHGYRSRRAPAIAGGAPRHDVLGRGGAGPRAAAPVRGLSRLSLVLQFV